MTMDLRLFIIFFLFLPFVAEASIIVQILPEKEVFQFAKDNVSVNISVTNQDDSELVNLTIHSILEGNCTPWIYQERLSFEPNETKNLIAHNFPLKEYDPGGRCTVIAKVFDDEGKVLLIQEKSFEVAGTLKRVKSEIAISSDPAGIGQRYIFVKGETIFLTMQSNLKPNTSSLIYPDGTVRDINLPEMILADAPGTYRVVLSYLEEGYISINSSKTFSVIDRPGVKDNLSHEGIKTRSCEEFLGLDYLRCYLVLAALIATVGIVLFLRKKVQRR